MWTEVPAKTFVLLDTGNKIKGSCYIKPNQAGRGSKKDKPYKLDPY